MSTIRMTGLSSNLDTESMITALTSTYQTKVDNLKGEQKKLSWKQSAWKTLNTQVTSFYNGTLSSMRFSDAYNKKTTTSTNTSAVSIVTGDSAMNTTQSLSITNIAKTAYLTGSKLNTTDSSTTMSTLGLTSDSTLSFAIGGSSTDTISVDVATTDTIKDVIAKINGATSSSTSTGVKASFDSTNGRIYIAGSDTGTAASFGAPTGSSDLLKALGLDTTASTNAAVYSKGEDSTITLNGVEYTSNSNTFEINGLTITANEEASGITLNTKYDTSGIYDLIKNFFSEYNTLMNKVSSLYNADSADSYNMLTDDDKDSMTDDEITDWEDKIKAALLRKDDTLGTFQDSITTLMQQSFDVKLADGTTSSLSLASFGINTLSYFEADEYERNAYHIDGNSSDSYTSGNTDLLSKYIASDPDALASFFTSLTKSVYSKMTDLMAGTDYSTSYTLYEDKLMASQYSDYTDSIADAEDALTAKQDYYYTKFSAMETALSKLNSTQSSLSSLFGS